MMVDYTEILLVVCFFVIFIAGLYLLVRWHANRYGYKCTECGKRFDISVATDFSSPHVPGKGGGKKYLKCPHCENRVWAQEVKKE